MGQNYVIPVFTSLVSAVIAIYIMHKKLEKEIELSEARLRHEYQTEFTVELAIKKLMKKGFALRSFSVIKNHIRGFEDDELKRMLLRSGCICFEVIKDDEYWGLLEENEDRLAGREELEEAGMEFPD